MLVIFHLCEEVLPLCMTHTDQPDPVQYKGSLDLHIQWHLISYFTIDMKSSLRYVAIRCHLKISNQK